MSKNVKAQINGSHYDNLSIEPIEVIQSLGSEYIKGFCIGNALKYLMRFEKKDGLADLKKAEWYISYLISQMSETTQEKLLLESEKNVINKLSP